jgi:hypothetical protein
MDKSNFIFCAVSYIVLSIIPFIYTYISFKFLGFEPKLGNFTTPMDVVIIVGPTLLFFYLCLRSSGWIQNHIEKEHYAQ